jgi:hypothetical protein
MFLDRLKKNKKTWKIIQNTYGSIFLEFALIMPLLLLFIAGIVQFGFALNAKIAVNSASYEAARAATLSDNPENSAIEAIENYASSTLPGWNLNERLSAKIDINGDRPGDLIDVEVTYKIPLFFTGLFPFSGNSDKLTKISGSSSMRIEEKE